MSRKPNTNQQGGSWTPQQIQAVWEKGLIIPGSDPGIWRRDKCQNTIRRGNHGDRNSEYGWEIDHITAVANGGTDELSNLQPLHWKNNASKSDQKNWSCPK